MDVEPVYLERLGELHGIQSYQIDRSYLTRSDRSYDACVTVTTKSGVEHLFTVQYKSHLSHKTVDHIIAQARESPGDAVLLLAPYIGAKLAAKLEAAGLNYLDRDGNCHIVLGSVYIHVEGRRTAAPQPSTDKGLRRASYQVLFTYLAEPELVNATVRTVAAMAGASRQPVSDMKRRLLDEGYIVKTKSAIRWARRWQYDALSLWLHGYETVVRPALVWGTYRTPDGNPEELENRIVSVFAEAGVPEFRWGGCSAGFRLAGHYRGRRTTVHVHSVTQELRNGLRALSDPRGNLVMMDAFGEINWQDTSATVHPLLAYSEMLSEGTERAREAAQELFAKLIQPIWEHRP